MQIDVKQLATVLMQCIFSKYRQKQIHHNMLLIEFVAHLESARNVKVLLHVCTQNLADAHESDIMNALSKPSCVVCLQMILFLE